MRPHGNRAGARLGGALLAVAAALAVLALPGLASSHGHHHDHGDAGTIQSFDPATGVLTIDLADGGSVSGLVVRRTKIRCGDDHGHHHGLHSHERRRGAQASSQGPEDPPGHDGTAPGRSEDPGKGAEHSHHCTTDDLVAGATVRVAELVLLDGKAVYKLVGLAKEEPEPNPV